MDSGSAVCQTSNECAPPTPYCSPTLSRCVQCESDVNCVGVGSVCNMAKGVCADCNTNADCFGPRPYCSPTLDRCAECAKDSNCGAPSIKCTDDGLCGSCGDGFCSTWERAEGVCSDCFAACGTTDLKSKLGDGLATGTLTTLVATSATACGPLPSTIATFTWTVPTTDRYVIDGGPLIFVSLLQDTCSGPPLACLSQVPEPMPLSKGQRVVILLSQYSGGSPYSLSIKEVSGCDPAFCPPMFGSTACCTDGDSCGFLSTMGCVASPSDPGSALLTSGECTMRATARGPTCDLATGCACNGCPGDYDNCKGNSICSELLDCLHRYDCFGPDYYTPDRCEKLIDGSGGPNGPLFGLAQSVTKCITGGGCQYDCGNQPTNPGGAGGVGTGGRVGTGDAGRGGVPNGAGGASNDVDAGEDTHEKATTSGGCGCSMPGRDSSGGASAAMLAGLGFTVARRRSVNRRRSGRPC